VRYPLHLNLLIPFLNPHNPCLHQFVPTRHILSILVNVDTPTNESSQSSANNHSRVHQRLDDSIDLTQIERLVQEGLDKHLATAAGLKHGLLDVDDSPLSDNIFAEAMSTFNFSTLDTFKGSDDSQDPETFVRVLGKIEGVGGL
jgi:hypothetical protein